MVYQSKEEPPKKILEFNIIYIIIILNVTTIDYIVCRSHNHVAKCFLLQYRQLNDVFKDLMMKLSPYKITPRNIDHPIIINYKLNPNIEILTKR